VEICSRIRAAREIAGVTQDQLANFLGIPRDRLSTYEKHRSPIKFDLGLRICRQLIISEEWLATGKTSIMQAVARRQLPPQSRGSFSELSSIFQRQCYDLLSEPVTLGIPPGMLFSEAFDTYLAATYELLADRFFYDPRIIFADERPEPQLAARYIDVIFQRAMKLLANEAIGAGADAWMVQRNFTRGMFIFCRKAYSELHDLGFDIAGFQSFVGAVEQARKQPQQKAPEKVA
jgi:transcriptional regulator with XRE-family HTH domain